MVDVSRRKLLERVNTPLTSSRDEWTEAFMDLAKLVVEGFETKLDAAQVQYKNDDKTIALLDKLQNGTSNQDDIQQLLGLRTVQNLRSKVKGHIGGSEAEQLAHDAIMEHETFANHFRHVCTKVSIDLETVEGLFL